MEINPIDKVQDIMEKLRAYNPSAKRKSDEGFEWLEEETDVCIEVLNPTSEDHLTIICEDDGEFTLCFGYTHMHCFGREDEYLCLCERALDILDNKRCSATLFCGDERKWLGSSFVNRENTEQSVCNVFEFVLKYEVFSNRLKADGGVVEYVFWNSAYNRTIVIK